MTSIYQQIDQLKLINKIRLSPPTVKRTDRGLNFAQYIQNEEKEENRIMNNTGKIKTKNWGTY